MGKENVKQGDLQQIEVLLFFEAVNESSFESPEIFIKGE
jgi:hypothetical protein